MLTETATAGSPLAAAAAPTVVGGGVLDDPCPLPAGKNRPGNDTHSANVISRYADPPFRNSSASITAYRAALSCSQS